MVKAGLERYLSECERKALADVDAETAETEPHTRKSHRHDRYPYNDGTATPLPDDDGLSPQYAPLIYS